MSIRGKQEWAWEMWLCQGWGWGWQWDGDLLLSHAECLEGLGGSELPVQQNAENWVFVSSAAS